MFYALVHGGCHGLGFQACLRDLGLPLKLTIESDSNSARAFASRRGLGTQRHVQTRRLWIQQRVKANDLEITRVPGKEHVSDILTKAVNSTTLEEHMKTMGLISVDRSGKMKHLSH